MQSQMVPTEGKNIPIHQSRIPFWNFAAPPVKNPPSPTKNIYIYYQQHFSVHLATQNYYQTEFLKPNSPKKCTIFKMGSCYFTSFNTKFFKKQEREFTKESQTKKEEKRRKLFTSQKGK